MATQAQRQEPQLNNHTSVHLMKIFTICSYNTCMQQLLHQVKSKSKIFILCTSSLFCGNDTLKLLVNKTDEY